MESMTPAPAPPETDARHLTRRQELRKDILELTKLVALFLIVFWGVKTFVVEGYEVQGPSMEPTLHDGERILVFKLPQMLSSLPFLGAFQPLKPSDIVVFESPVENKRYVKRVIACGPASSGKTVQATTGEGAPPPGSVQVLFDHGTVYVNNRRIEEDYLEVPDQHVEDVQSLTLGPGEYYVLGDHRNVSKDSRSFNAVHHEQVVGRALLRFWPLKKFGFIH